MKLSELSRWTPLHWTLTALAASIAIISVCVVLGGLGFRWDPFDLAERRADRAVADADTARVAASARTIEAAAAQDTTRAVERAATDRAAATHIVHRYTLQLEASSDDPIPVPDDGADLRDALGQLCDLRRAVCSDPAHAAPARDAGLGPPGLPDPAAPR